MNEVTNPFLDARLTDQQGKREQARDACQIAHELGHVSSHQDMDQWLQRSFKLCHEISDALLKVQSLSESLEDHDETWEEISTWVDWWNAYPKGLDVRNKSLVRQCRNCRKTVTIDTITVNNRCSDCERAYEKKEENAQEFEDMEARGSLDEELEAAADFVTQHEDDPPRKKDNPCSVCGGPITYDRLQYGTCKKCGGVAE